MRWQKRPLLSLLLLSPWFRLVFLALLAGGLLLAASLPKIWRATPPGFRPEVRISGLDKLQAWALKRSARQALATGKPDKAVLAWRGACANNPADLAALRGLLETVMRVERPDKSGGQVLELGQWLLRLGGTNLADVRLVAHGWLRCGVGERAARLLDSRPEAVSGSLDALYAMCLLQAARWDEYAARMQTNAYVQRFAASLAQPASPLAVGRAPEEDFELYGAAYLAGWGPEEQRTAALARLRAARRRLPTEMLAYDLEFRVHFYRRDIGAYWSALQELESLGKVAVRHFVGYWSLLLAEGDRDTALASARTASLGPRNAEEVCQLARLYVLLDLTDKADALLSRSIQDAGWLTDTILLYSEVLIRQRAWDRLRSLALRLRSRPATTETLGGLPYYLEGLSYFREGNPERAEELFHQMAVTGFTDPTLAMRAADGLLRLNAATHAERILLPHRATLEGNLEYLKLLNDCAVRLKHDAYLLEVAAALYALQPEDPAAANNWAAALVIFHQHPDTAILLTRQLFADHPDSPGVIDNHIGALLLNNRVEEAEALLARIDPARLGPAGKAQYLLSTFEAHVKRGRAKEALEVAARIPRNELYPVQVRWLEDNLRRLPPESKAES